MPAYVAFLRAINLGRTRKFPMAELRDCLGRAGFGDVETYIQTGNVRLTAPHATPEEVAADCERVFAEQTGFEVPTVVLTPTELGEVHAAAVALGPPAAEAGRRYVTFLKEPLPPVAAEGLDGWTAPGEGARVIGRAVHWWIDHPTRDARLSNARIERTGAVGTTRDLKVVTTLAERWAPASP